MSDGIVKQVVKYSLQKRISKYFQPADGATEYERWGECDPGQDSIHHLPLWVVYAKIPIDFCEFYLILHGGYNLFDGRERIGSPGL